MRKGKCLRCGRCCKAKMLWNTTPLKQKILITILKQKILFDKKSFLNFICPNAVQNNGKWQCNIYLNRPDFCKKYPESVFDLIDNNCGYKFSEKYENNLS